MIDEIKSVLDKVYPNPPRDTSVKALKILESEDAELITIEDKKTIVGFAIRNRLAEKIYKIDFVVIIPEYQGKGYGIKLMDKVHSENGLYLLESRNKKEFYMKLGYVEMKNNWMYKIQ